MFEKKSLTLKIGSNKKPGFLLVPIVLRLALGSFNLWAGDTASFVDLGFSADGTSYTFGQYGVQAKTLKPWADLIVVDVPKNNYVPNGKVSYTHSQAVAAGQDGSGILYRLLTQNNSLVSRHGVDYLHQGQPLYISLEDFSSANASGETVEFRDFHSSSSYRAVLVPTVEGAGTSLKSSFVISMERSLPNGSTKTYKVGTPLVKRPQIASYRIRKVLINPQGNSMIFVIEMKKLSSLGADFDIQYMVEALRL
jgi:predicted secreted protein